MNKFLKHSGVISSWFYVPPSMAGYELLSRSSAFIIRKDPNKMPFGKQFHILTCAHVTHPHLFPKYYPQDWLKHIEGTAALFETRDPETGDMLTRWNCEQEVYVHPNMDLSVCHLENEDELRYEIDLGKIMPLELKERPPRIEIGYPMKFYGFSLVNEEENKQAPTITSGIVNLVHKNRIYASSQKVLEMGMCGGVVFNQDENFVGMIEGIVDKKNQIDARLLENAVFIPVAEIKRFLNEIEVTNYHEISRTARDPSEF